MIRTFEASLTNQGIGHGAVAAARYSLCALLDETVLGTPWGSESLWSKESLLSILHDETRGGKNFFQILQNASQDAARNIDLLELLYVCLSLGFQGQFGVRERGGVQLAEEQQKLYRTILNQRGEFERELSPSWRGIVDRRPAVSRFVPVWVIPIAATALAVLIFMAFSNVLNRSSDAAYSKLSGLGREVSEVQGPEIGIVDPGPSGESFLQFQESLAEEVKRGLIDLQDRGTSTRIIVHNKGLFKSGQATVSNELLPLINKIGRVLNDQPGPIRVIGHTDSQPIRTLRFPSNWHLSQARAESVQAVLAGNFVEPGKLVAKGHADTEPLDSTDTDEGRRRNRRIEIDVPKL